MNGPGPFAIVMTVAGSDSGGGAGIEADLKTISALGAYATCAVTAVTAQNTLGVQGMHVLPAAFVGRQIDSVMSDMGAAAAKTGMLANEEIVRVVADRVERHHVENLVVDPVMVAKSGDRLLAPEAEQALVERLLPLALVVTPNLDEAQWIVGFEVRNEVAMARAARAIHEMGPRYVLVKGGHLSGPPTDVLFDGHHVHTFAGRRIESRHTHGTGCTYSAAIATELAFGREVVEAVPRAREFVRAAIEHAVPIGRGTGPLNPFFEREEGQPS